MSLERRRQSNETENRRSSEIEILCGRGFKISHLIGKGKYAKVYRSEFTSINTNEKYKLACKIINTNDIPTNIITNFLPRELHTLKKLNHPHIIQIHSIFQWRTKYYIFMRLAENGDLLDYIINNGPINELQAKIWLRQICLAIQYLHMMEIAHRDIKCDNILITIHHNCKLTDFGFSRFLLDNNNKNIMSNTYCGTLSYASPQILLGEYYNPKASDIWSIGCVLFNMLNKSQPFNSNNMKTMIDNQLTKNYNYHIKYMNRYDQNVFQLINCLLEPNEKKRFKIEQILSSNWITMEVKLKQLNKYEFNALAEAIEISIQYGMNPNQLCYDEKRISYRKTSLVNYLKEYDIAFNINLVQSESQVVRKL